MESLLDNLNNSRVFLALLVLVSNLCGKYIDLELSDEAKVFVMEINLVDQETNQARRTLDRLILAKEGYTTRLHQILEPEPDSDYTNEEPAN